MSRSVREAVCFCAVRLDLSSYTIRFYSDEGHPFRAEVTELPGLIAVGRTIEELRRAVEEAIYLYLDDHPDAPRHFLPGD